MKVHTDLELRQLAVDIAEGRVFTSDQCPTKEMLASCFVILALGGFKGLSDEELGNIGLIYEYRSKRLPLTANG